MKKTFTLSVGIIILTTIVMVAYTMGHNKGKQETCTIRVVEDVTYNSEVIVNDLP
jgi:hypothetical protein